MHVFVPRWFLVVLAILLVVNIVMRYPYFKQGLAEIASDIGVREAR